MSVPPVVVGTVPTNCGPGQQVRKVLVMKLEEQHCRLNMDFFVLVFVSIVLFVPFPFPFPPFPVSFASSFLSLLFIAQVDVWYETTGGHP